MRTTGKTKSWLMAGCVGVALASPLWAQVNPASASAFFAEADALCRKDGGRLWGVSLCGPMVFADAATETLATNRETPAAARPATLGFANAVTEWGGQRWSTYVWQMIPSGKQARGRLLIHELFHRVQPELGLLIPDSPNDHLDTSEGRYWMQLEWRALAAALRQKGAARAASVSDALAFRAARRAKFPGAGDSERSLEISEGLAQYTGTAVAAATAVAAIEDAVQQLSDAAQTPSYVRTFAYSSGTAYGLLLDSASPGWTRRIRSSDDLAELLRLATGWEPAGDADSAAARYGGPELRTAERTREAEQRLRISALRQKFVDGPVLVLPHARTSTSITTGRVVIPGAGTVLPKFRTVAEWGTLEAENVLIPPDRNKVVVPAPARPDTQPVTGEGWVLRVAEGWKIQRASRDGDYELVSAASLRH